MPASTQLRTSAAETEFVRIPKTPLKVSRVALGTWAMGGWMWGGTDRRESVATIQAALVQGINLIDTVAGWSLNRADRDLVEHIVDAAVTDPVGPEFMAPPPRSAAGARKEMAV
jgi:hypothetical protein